MVEIPDFAKSGALFPTARICRTRTAPFSLCRSDLPRGQAAEMAIEQSAKSKFVINLKAARAMGLAIPQALVVRANEVIQ